MRARLRVDQRARRPRAALPTITVACAVLRMPYRVFAACVALSSAVWAALFLAAGAVFGDEAARVVGSQTAVVVGTAISVVGIGAFLLLRLRSGRHPLGRRPLAVTALLAAQLLLLAADFQAGPAAALGVLAVVALLPAGWLLDGWLSVLALGGFVCARWVDYSLAPDSAVTTICELGAGGAAIVAARLAAGSASRARAQVARDASHDLRTPLTVLQGYLSMLEDGSIPRDQARQLAALLGGKTRELNEKIDTMLDRLQR